ncbi:GOLPH3/VPS74 family protein [Microlunatus sp. Y2014]|uniref:GOLPH3/VPS74 family protein n=1 Tax=Microlunatus sp. Y2014 TaxID=3418488 RepID=UPI003DA6F930
MTDLLRAEELALLLVRAKGGWQASKYDVADILAGALLGELADEEHIDRRVSADDFWGRRRVHTDGWEPPTDPSLARVWHVADQGKGATTVQMAVAKFALDEVVGRLQARELVSVTKRSVLGDKVELMDTTARDAVRTRLRAIILDGVEPTDRDRSQLWLLHHTHQTVVLRDAFREHLTIHRFIRDLGRPEWPEKAAIDLVQGRAAAAASG